jgi:peptidoglycan/LPS O-acetylase OafA/YrhL
MGAERTSGRLPALDGLRGLAAAIVVVHHVALASSVTIADSYQGGELSTGLKLLSPLWAGPPFVIVFFVLSGFVLALPAANGRPFDPRAYYPSRLLRLYLPVWGALVFALLVHAVEDSRTLEQGTWWLNAHVDALSRSALAHDTTLLLGTGKFALNSVLWSLRWEILFSLGLPAYVWLARRTRAAHLPLALAAVAVIALSGTHEGVRYMPTFLLGALLAFNRGAIGDLATALARPTLGARAVKAGMVLAAVGLLGYPRYLAIDVGLQNALVAVGAVLAVLVPMVVASARAALTTSGAQWLGTRSFSLYLVHEPIVVALAFGLNAPSVPVLLLASAVLAAVAAELFFRVVERPSHRVARAAGARAAAGRRELAVR